jgi:creatinine amidohydrolase
LPHTDYGAHTWLELRELASRDDVVVVISTATLEDHGYHLPIDTDVRLVEAIARGAVERFNAEARFGAAMRRDLRPRRASPDELVDIVTGEVGAALARFSAGSPG